MALTKCEECGGPLSDRAMSCPHCGAPVRKRGRLVAAAIVGLLAALAAGLLTRAGVREGAGAGDERIAGPMIVAGVIAMVAAVMGVVALVRGTRR
jgi:nitrate reductase gamma subunit